MSDHISIAIQHYPPGFRFHPSDEELIVHYLMKRLRSCPLPAPIVGEIELYNYNPWDLPNKSLFGEDEWYFFTPRNRKYPNGVRPNRRAASGFWKATGTDKPILSASGSRRIGVKKALVFYTGRPPKGVKTDWIMTEYRLPDTMTRPSRSKGSMRLDDWVLCRIRQKGNTSKNSWTVEEDMSSSGPPTPSANLVNNYTYNNNYLPKIEELPSAYIQATKTTPPDNYLWKDCQILMASMLSSQNLPPIVENSNSNSNSADQTFGGGKGVISSKLVTRTDSFLENMLVNPTTKPKQVEGNNVGGSNEGIHPRNLVRSTMMNSYYSQNQAQGNNLFTPAAQSDAVMSLLLSREGY